MSSELINFKARLFKALGDPTRLKIIEFLRRGEKCVCEIVPYLGLPQPTVSRHLKILRESGLVRFRKDGVRRLYSLTSPAVLDIVDRLDEETVVKLMRSATRQPP